MIFAAVVAVLLLISSSLIADDARKVNDILRFSGYSADKLSAAAVCRNFKLQWNPLLFWHLYSGDTSIQGTPLFRGQKIWSRWNVHIIFVFVTSIYFINTNEIPSELSCENLKTSSHVKITCYQFTCHWHVKISLLLWLHKKPHLSDPKTI